MRTKVLLLAAVMGVFSNPALADYDEEGLFMYGDEDFVSIATGHKQLISKAPAVASVVTAEDIRRTGAKDLNEALELVAGLHVSVRSAAYNPIFQIRGVGIDFNTQVLMLINGIPVTNVYTGDRSVIWGGMSVESISRIEVIRGPGSAIYGADAFSGIINIITKNGSEIDGLETGVSTGSFDTHRAWMLYGGDVNGWETAFTLEVGTSNGHEEKVGLDFQNQLDDMFGTSASLAPGSVNTGRDQIESRFEMSKGEWRFRMGYQGRNNIETGAGVNGALDPFGHARSYRFTMDATYHDPDFSENLDVQNTVSFFDSATRINLTLLPPGTDFTLMGGDLFPNGIIGNPDIYERHYRFDSSAFYTGIEKHNIRVGGGFHYIDQYKIKESKNFTYVGGQPQNLGSVVEATGMDLFNREEERKIYYLSLQDEWDFATDWSLTTGVRYDHYSDFGGTVNPRLALVWDTSYNLTTKFLYGRAFRAPSFSELFNLNNPVAIGNSDLDPEIINTYELAFDYNQSGDLRAGLNLFYYDMKDIIRFTPVAQNEGDQEGYGFEVEVTWKANHNTTLMGNFAYQDSTDKETDSNAGHAPKQQLYLRLDHQLVNNWSTTTQLNYVMDRKRVGGDARKSIDDYATLDFTLSKKGLPGGFDAAISLRNLTDEDVREPDFYNPLTDSVNFVDDLPMAGRSITAEIRRSW